MEIFREYIDLVNFYDKDPKHPRTHNALINICYLPEFYSRFGLNTDKQELALSSKHLYTMQVSKEDGYYKESSDTHYHNLKKDIMLKLPELLVSPEFVFYDQSYNDKRQAKKPASLVLVLKNKSYLINNETKKNQQSVLVAYIEEPLDNNCKTTILATAFRRSEIEKYLLRLINNDRTLYISEDYLNKKKSLSSDYPGIQFPNIASTAFFGSLSKNIRQYRENVNFRKMEISGLFLEHIPEIEKTRKICNIAFENNPYSINYFPKEFKNETYVKKVWETLDKNTIQTIPNSLLIDSLKYFLQNTKQCNHQSKIIYRTINNRLSDTQKLILSESIDKEKEPSEFQIIDTFENWSNGNFYTKLQASQIPQNIQSVSDTLMSFEKKQSSILDIIGKHFDTDDSGKPTLDGMKSLSKAMEIYSDKHFETARYLFIKEGTIIRHITVSSQSPSSTIIKPDDKFLYDLKSFAKETESKIVFLHNHPSGYVEPSQADVKLTEYMNNFFSNQDGMSYFAGHIILDHGSFGLYDVRENKWNALIDNEIFPISEVENHYKIQLSKHGKKLELNTRDNSVSEKSLKELSEYAKQCDAGNIWNTKDWIPGFIITGGGIVTSFEQFNNLDFQNQKALSEKLKVLGRKYGSENIILFPRNKEQFLICERFAQDTGKIKDVFYEKQDGSFEVSSYRNGNIFNDLRTDEIKIEDTRNDMEKVNEKLIREQSVNKNIIKDGNTMEIMEEKLQFDESMDISYDENAEEKKIANNLNTEINSDETFDFYKKQFEALQIANKQLLEKLQEEKELNQYYINKIESLEKAVFAKKDVSANDSRSADGNYTRSPDSPHVNLTNQKGFGRDTAYKVNTPLPPFGIDIGNNEVRIIKNACFQKLILSEDDISQNKVILNITKEDGTHEDFEMPEKDYNQIINNVQELEERKQGITQDSFAWMKAHMDYAQKMNIDKNSYRLNTPENFIHNFRIHCRKGQAHNSDEALKIAGIMYEKMQPRDKERFLKMREDWDKEYGNGAFDLNLIKEFGENHRKNDIDISKVAQKEFSEDKAFEDMNPVIEMLKTGDKIENTKFCVGDTVNFDMSYKSFDGTVLKVPDVEWKIKNVSKNLYSKTAIIYNEKSKEYYKIPLENLVKKLRKIEKSKALSQNEDFSKNEEIKNKWLKEQNKKIKKEIKQPERYRA